MGAGLDRKIFDFGPVEHDLRCKKRADAHHAAAGLEGVKCIDIEMFLQCKSHFHCPLSSYVHLLFHLFQC